MNWLRRSSTSNNSSPAKNDDRKNKSDNSDLAKLQDENNIYDDGEVLVGEPKNLILSIISQLRPGMDLSRVTLPVFILETKSFLEKLTGLYMFPTYLSCVWLTLSLSDFMTHPDLLIGLKLETPEERIKAITRFYLSGFYIRPKV